MAILRAAATANFTLDNTGTAVLITGLTLTPAADDYFLYATIETLTPGSAGGDEDVFSVWVNNVEVAHTLRTYHNNSSIDNASIVMVITCKVSPTGSQAVEIRHTSESTSAPLIASHREMTLFPIPTAGTDYELTATANDTTTSSTFSLIVGMAQTPVSGNYLVTFSTSVLGGAVAGSDAGFRITVGGSVVTASLRNIFYESSGDDQELMMMVCASISPNGSQAVEIEFNQVDGSSTVTVGERTMNLIPVASADIFDAVDTVDDTDSTTTDKLLEGMTITDPGAFDYLTLFSMTHAFATLGSADLGRVTYSVHEGGAVVTDSERDNEIEDSLDNGHMLAFCGGRVTVGGGTDDLEIFWQGASVEPRTGRDRIFIAMREATAADPTITDIGTDEEFDDAETGIVVTGTDFEATQGTGKLEISDNATYGSGNVVGQTETAWGATSITFTCVLGAMAPGTPRYAWVTNDTGDRNAVGFVVHVHRAKAIAMSLSANIAASGENTTGQLTAPTAGSFFGGRIQDDENPADAVDPGDGQYLEDEWCIEALPAAVVTETYQFRVLIAGVVADTISVTPDLTIIDVGPIDATAALVFSAAADLKGKGKLDATAAIIFAAPTVDLEATGKLDATAALTFSAPTVDLKAIGALDATAAMIFSATSALLRGTGVLAATASLAFATATADLDATGKLDASPALAFSATADLKGVGTLNASPSMVFGAPTVDLKSSASLDASPALVFGGTADLKADGELDATAAMVFSAAVDLNATGQLDASPALVFGATANLTLAPNPITATAALVFGGTADLKGQGTLDATSALVFGGTADLKGRGTLDATSLLVFGGTADLRADGAINATAALVFGANADLIGIGKLDATSALVFSGTADLIGIGELNSTSALIFGGTADLKGLGDLSATAAMVFGGTADLKADGVLDATANLIFSATANLINATPGGDIDATALMTFGGTADLKGDGKLDAESLLVFSAVAALQEPLFATSAIVFGGTADLIGLGDLDATAAMIFGGTFDLQAEGKLDATAALVFSATADLKTPPSQITASPSMVFTQVADLKADGKLDATVPMVFGGTADLSALGKLDATALIVFSATADLPPAGPISATALMLFDGTADLKGSGQLDAIAAIVFGGTFSLSDGSPDDFIDIEIKAAASLINITGQVTGISITGATPGIKITGIV